MAHIERVKQTPTSIQEQKLATILIVNRINFTTVEIVDFDKSKYIMEEQAHLSANSS